MDEPHGDVSPQKNKNETRTTTNTAIWHGAARERGRQPNNEVVLTWFSRLAAVNFVILAGQPTSETRRNKLKSAGHNSQIGAPSLDVRFLVRGIRATAITEHRSAHGDVHRVAVTKKDHGTVALPSSIRGRAHLGEHRRLELSVRAVA